MTQRPPSKWKLPLIIIAVAIAIIALLNITKPQPPTVASVEKAWLVDAEAIAIADYHPQLSLLGTVTSPFNARLSSVLSADVLAVPIREGNIVAKGQLLVSLDQREIGSRVQQRQADVSELAALIKAEHNRYEADKRSLIEEKRLLKVSDDALKRQNRLKSANLVAQERLELAESQVAQKALALTARQQSVDDHPNRLNQLKARLKRATAAFSDAELDLERSEITAPFDGIVTEVHVAPGDRVQPGEIVVGLFDTQHIEVRAQLPDKYLSIIQSALSDGDSINASARTQGSDVAFSLNRIAGQSNANSGGVDAFFTPHAGHNPLILNSTLRLTVSLPAVPESFTLPVSALYGTNRIYRLANDRIESIEVDVLGRLSNPQEKTRVIIAKGTLDNGVNIITTQLPNAISGLKVSLREQPSD